MNLSNIRDLGELKHHFEFIRDSNVSGKVPFVLFDEVDTQAQGENTFRYLTMPMWDGVYSDVGITRKLGSAVFFFAGTFQSQLTSLGVTIEEKDERAPTQIAEKTLKVASDVIPSLLGSIVPPDVSSIALTAIPAVLAAAKKAMKFLRRDQWAQNALQGLMSLAESGIEPKFADFLDRVDRFIFIPSLHLYFKDMDAADQPYFLDKETVYFYISRIKNTWPQIKSIERSALATLAWHYLRSRREMERCVFLSKPEATSTVYKLEHVPEYLRVDGQLTQLSTDLGVNLTGRISLA